MANFEVGGNDRYKAKRAFVIQRASESRCEWWTGSDWSEDENKAQYFSEEPNPAEVTGDESADVEAVENLAR